MHDPDRKWTPAEIEQAKILANYWNGLAVAIMAISVLPLLVARPGVELTSDLSFWIEAFGTIIIGAALSRLFRTLALRAVSKIR